MSEFTDARDRLLQTRDEKERARQSLLEAREQLRKVAAKETELNRVFNAENTEHTKRRDSLARARTKAETALTKSRTDLTRQTELELGRFTDFGLFTDPRQQIEQFREDFPILLLPVRIETRFKTVTSDNRTLQQLWVRIYPDECAVDTFEAMLSKSEIESAQSYWGEIWRAGRVEEGDLGAWRALVGSHGSGRAAWMASSTPGSSRTSPRNAPADRSASTSIAMPAPPAPAPSSRATRMVTGVGRSSGRSLRFAAVSQFSSRDPKSGERIAPPDPITNTPERSYVCVFRWSRIGRAIQRLSQKARAPASRRPHPASAAARRVLSRMRERRSRRSETMRIQPTTEPPLDVAGYPARLRDALGVEVINSGRSGERTYEGRRRLPGVLAATSPDYVILLEGTNDIGEGRVNAPLEDLAAMVDSVLAAGALPILGTVTPACCGHRNSHPQSRIESYNAGVRALAEENKIPLVDFYQAFVPPEPDAAFDDTSGLIHVPEGLHPTPAGYDLMAATAAAIF